MIIGFCGLGLMGTPMARRLLAAGHELRVWNRSPARAAVLGVEGARVCETPRALGEQCDYVLMCVYDAAAVEAVVFGPQGLAEAAGVAVVVDHSSIPPDATRRFAARLEQASGAVWVDAPVSGGTGGADAGTLAIMAGGPRAAFDAVEPVLTAYARRITHMGDTGAGQVAKLCNQTIVATTIAAIAEAVGLARDAGVDPARLAEALGGGWADSTLLQIFVPRMTQPPPPVQAGLDTMLKDLDTVAALARAQGSAVPVAAAAGQSYRLASRRGLGPQDVSQLARLYERADGGRP
ncbi:NAD(P)-dependent oxidoreductase [Castellaniella sp. GW247-6E4]|uniref:NAD(P)-dependent oxidoreductase n=1 Tax=Castellaniella sp. GW247-6E4 TaxID=3140380 RepID=UPI0033154889